MMNKEIDKIGRFKNQVAPLLKSHGVVRSSLFGSYVHGDAREDSDIDLLIEFPKGKTLFDLIGLKQELEGMLRKKVDLLTFSSVSPKLKSRIEQEAVSIYGS